MYLLFKSDNGKVVKAINLTPAIDIFFAIVGILGAICGIEGFCVVSIVGLILSLLVCHPKSREEKEKFERQVKNL